MIEQINNTLQILRRITENLDELGVNTEVIERSNVLIYDKLDTIENISKKRNQTTDVNDNIRMYKKSNLKMYKNVHS